MPVYMVFQDPGSGIVPLDVAKNLNANYLLTMVPAPTSFTPATVTNASPMPTGTVATFATPVTAPVYLYGHRIDTTQAAQVYVRAYDGLLWTGWASGTMYTHNRASNTVPVVSAANQNIDLNQWRLITELVGVTDANGDGIVQYQLRDLTGTASSGSLWAGGVQYAQGATVTVSSLANTWMRGGAAAGADTYEVRAFDGAGWSSWASLSLNTRTQPNRAPTVTPTAANQTVARHGSPRTTP